MEKISVIVPVYNVETYLKQCVDSILKQSYRQLEIFLVDDGSTDRSPQICDDYRKADDRVRVIHKPNGGLSSARNAGIEAASGEYLSFIDSDDTIHPDFYRVLKDTADRTGSDIVQCAIERVRQPAAEWRECDLEKTECREFSGEEALRQFYGTEFVDFKSSCNKLFRSKLFAQLRYPEGKIYEDRWIAAQLYLSVSKVVYLRAPMYFYLVNENGIMHAKLDEKQFDTCLLYLSHYDYFVQRQRQDLAAMAIRQFFISLLNLRYVYKKYSGQYKKYLPRLRQLFQGNKSKLWNQKGIGKGLKIALTGAWYQIWAYFLVRDLIDFYQTTKRKRENSEQS